MTDEQGEIPESVQSALFDFHSSITAVEDILAPFFAKPLEENETKAEPLQKARIELMAIFAANSLQWMHLATRGENPTKHPILDELTRIKKYMDRLKELEDRVKAPKLDKRAAKNFIRSAMWEPNNNEADDQIQDASTAGTSNAQSDIVEQQLDEVLKRYRDASTAKHTRFEDPEDKEEPPMKQICPDSSTKNGPVKGGDNMDRKRRKRKADIEIVDD